MKKFLLAVLLLAPLSLSAQKFAHFDLQATVEALPAYKTATAELQSLGEQYQKNLEDMQKELQDNEKAFTEERSKKLQPIIQKVMDAVSAISSEGSYVYIIDVQSAQQANIFINKSLSEDVTAKVKAKLGI